MISKRIASISLRRESHRKQDHHKSNQHFIQTLDHPLFKLNIPQARTQLTSFFLIVIYKAVTQQERDNKDQVVIERTSNDILYIGKLITYRLFNF